MLWTCAQDLNEFKSFKGKWKGFPQSDPHAFFSSCWPTLMLSVHMHYVFPPRSFLPWWLISQLRTLLYSYNSRACWLGWYAPLGYGLTLGLMLGCLSMAGPPFLLLGLRLVGVWYSSDARAVVCPDVFPFVCLFFVTGSVTFLPCSLRISRLE